MIYKLVTRVIQNFCFPETYERWGHLGFLERGEILEKGGAATMIFLRIILNESVSCMSVTDLFEI